MGCKLKVHLNGTEKNGWAMDEEMAHIHEVLKDKVDLVSLDECEVVHSVYWWKLVQLPASKLKNKKIICSISNKPFHEFTEPLFMNFKPLVGCVIAKSNQAVDEFQGAGIQTSHISYSVNDSIFKPFEKPSEIIESFQKKWNIPKGKYLVGNFHRDSEGQNINNPKIQKGPEVFLSIVKRLFKKNTNIHVLLAGPRRHWLKKRLSEFGIPWSYVGEDIEGDDNSINIQSRETLNLLYNLIDLYIISSRWEGGPHSALEAAASKCKIVSSRVGVAVDALEDVCIFDNIDQAIDVIHQDVNFGLLDSTIEIQYERFKRCHTIEAVGSDILSLYENIEKIPTNVGIYRNSLNDDRFVSRVFGKVNRMFSIERNKEIRLFFPEKKSIFESFGLSLKDEYFKEWLERRIVLVESAEDADVIVASNYDGFVKSHQKYIQWISSEKLIDKDQAGKLSVAQVDATISLFSSAWAFEEFVRNIGCPSRPVLLTDTSFYQLYEKGKVVENSKRKILFLAETLGDINTLEKSIQFSDEIECEWLDVSKDSTLINLSDIRVCVDLTKKGIIGKTHFDCLQKGIPCISAKGTEISELISYGGLTYDSRENFSHSLEKVLSDYSLYQDLILCPNGERLGAKICEIVVESLYQ